MREVSALTAALLLDALERHGRDPAEVFSGLPISRDRLLSRTERIDWDLWVEMMQRAEDACGGPDATERLFVRGAGARIGHPFVRLVNAFMSLDDVYVLFARWGLNRNFMMRARFERGRGPRATFIVAIDEDRAGSLPTFRFLAGVLRHLPGLHGLPDAEVTLADATPHRAVFHLVLPEKRSLRARARRALSLLRGAAATLDELADQSRELHDKNVELERQVSELRRTAAALREREEWLDLALDVGRIGIWRWDLSRRQLRTSVGLANVLGQFDTHDTTAEALMAAIHPDDRGRVVSAVRAAAVTGAAPLEAEYRLLRNGEARWVRVNGRVVPDATGEPEYLLGTLADVTDQKLFESRLRFADRLISTGTLAAGVAHEINTPLTYVLGSLELLRRTAIVTPALEARVSRHVADITDGLERIREIVRDLRTFARPEQGDATVVDVTAVCDAAIRILTPVVRQRARIHLDYDARAPKVHANDSRLAQVVVNLVLNASQAMPERPAGENEIRVRTRLDDDRVVVEVEDNGVGIDSDALPRIFDPFFTTKGAADGTGLGLSICHATVSALGGRIDVESQLGRGTIFRVTLPSANANVARSPAPPAHSAHSARSAPKQTPNRRVLVIDDEPAVCRTVSMLLELEGWAVREAHGAREALAAIRSEERFDAVLCDVVMPDMSGVEAYAVLEREHADLARRMVFMTGGLVNEDARALLERQDAVVIEKPFEVGALLEALARAMDR